MSDVSGKLGVAVPTDPHSRQRARPIVTAAHVGAGAGWGAVSFMIAYGVLHAQQIAGRQLALVSRLSPIPLFAVFLASICCAVVAFVIFTARANADVEVLPRVLAIASLVFTCEMLCFP